MAQRIIHRVADGSQFDGTASSGLITFNGKPSDKYEYVIYQIALDVQTSGASAAALTSCNFDLIDTTSGTLAYDNETGAPGTETVITGDGDGDATGDFVAVTDDGAAGALFLKNIVGTFADDDALTGDDTFVADGNGTVDFTQIRVDTTASLNFRLSDDGLPVPVSDDTALTDNSLSVVSTGMVGNGTLTVTYGYRYITE